uniref:PDZ domain-containing protein n=1 Tax=Prorocentrum micans TaxID=2945 RepID=A0A7S2X485_PROMC|mmetsp:Transcript_16180/g.13009  ORF Transcript_16180/g.13009 Transcript_16180/m.13009 type:complete len:146 (+) Transcript_16180:132-569(+)
MACCCAPAVESTTEVTPQEEPQKIADVAVAEPKAEPYAKGAEPAAETWEVKVQKAAEGPQSKIGLDIFHFPNSADGNALKIKTVKDGLVKDWNERNQANTVQAGDLIVACNGKKGDSKAILQAISESKELTLTIQRQRGAAATRG